jgi:plasmid maintenance system antidote protein VapI
MFNPSMTEEELAELFGVSGPTVTAWIAQGASLPVGLGARRAARSGAALRNDWEISRRELAALLGVHADTVTKWLRDGLAGAVVERGGRGEEMTLDARLGVRWWLAHEGVLNLVTLDDFRVMGSRNMLALSQFSAISLLGRLSIQDAPSRPRKS